MSTPAFLSAASANAIISDLRPTTLSTPALEHINNLVDEVLSLLVFHSESINPTHIRNQGVAAVFTGDNSAGETTGPRALGRAAVADAEFELRSWFDSHREDRLKAFRPNGQSTGLLRPSASGTFPVREATEVLKLRCISFSTLSPTDPIPEEYEQQILTAWRLAGGDVVEATLLSAALWMTAILEHICEHILDQLSRVVARDSSIAVASVHDLYTALCEDESIWGLFKRLKVKTSLEAAINATKRQRRVTPGRHAPSSSFGGSSNTSGSKSSIPQSSSLRDTSLEQARLAASTPVENIPHSVERERERLSKGPVANVARKVSSATTRSSPSQTHHRSGSALSANTKSIVSAFNDQQAYENDQARRPSHDEDEFDALVRSGETMKVSLTPSRLKTFENSANRRSPASPTQPSYVRAMRPTQSPEMPSDDLSPLTPSNAYPSNDSPRKPSPLRPSSGARLVARNAATIKEDQEDEEEEMDDEVDGYLGGGQKPKKESLAEMFAAEAKSGSRKSSGSSSKKRTVPAVVLGSPPPRESSLPSQPHTTTTTAASPPAPARRTKRNDLTVDTTDDDLFRPRKPKSEAQELADFFTNTLPPGAPRSNAPDDDFAPPQRTIEEPPKSAKSFKSFMSRMTGGKKDKDKDKSQGSKDKEGNRPPMPTSFSHTGLAGLVKRQRSTTSFASTAVPTPTVGEPLSATPSTSQQPPSRRASEATQTAPMRPYPESLAAAGKAARRPSNEPLTSEEMGAIGVAAFGMGSGVATTAVAPEKRMTGLSVDTQADRTVDPHADAGVTVPEPSRPADSPTIGATDTSSALPTPNPGLADLSPEIPPATSPIRDGSTDEYVVVNKSDASPTPTSKVDGPSPTKPTPSTATHSQFPSEAASFTTAHEIADGESDEQLSERDIDERRNTITAPAPTQYLPPSVPLSDLVPLRGLLQHATTARECQLLLGAILTQLGVPLSPSDSTSGHIDPEAIVAAWLLAGREGPVDYPYPPTWSSKPTTTTEEPDESIATPTVTLSELHPVEVPDQEADDLHLHVNDDSSQLLRADSDQGQGRSRTISGGSDATSMARTSDSSVPEVKEAMSAKWVEAVHVPVTPHVRVGEKDSTDAAA